MIIGDWREKKIISVIVLAVAIVISLIGLFVSALLIAVLSQKLSLDRAEKYVHGFVIGIQLAKRYEAQASNTIKFAFKLWVLRRKGKTQSVRYLFTEQKFFRSISISKEIKQERKRVTESLVNQTEIFTMQRSGNEKIDTISIEMNAMKMKVDKIEEQLVEVQKIMNKIQNGLNALLSNVAQQSRS